MESLIVVLITELHHGVKSVVKSIIVGTCLMRALVLATEYSIRIN